LVSIHPTWVLLAALPFPPRVSFMVLGCFSYSRSRVGARRQSHGDPSYPVYRCAFGCLRSLTESNSLGPARFSSPTVHLRYIDRKTSSRQSGLKCGTVGWEGAHPFRAYLCQVLQGKQGNPPSSGLRLAQIFTALSGACASTRFWLPLVAA